jgi:integrase
LGAVKRLLKTWPGLSGMEPGGISAEDAFAWAARFKAEGTGFRPPGARAVRRGNSASSVNSAVDALRQILDLAVERGLIRQNPASGRRLAGGGRLKKAVRRKALLLPSRVELDALFKAMEGNGSVGGGGAEAADFCRFLMMSGARLGEAALVTWRFVSWERGLLHLPGYKTESSARFVPLHGELAALLRRIQERRRSAARFRKAGISLLGPDDAVFRIRECQKTIDAACGRTGIQRITHHDFRHVFATTCVENGVDIPTVARWMGHGDGGVLAMRTYGHLRPDHSQVAARRVRFGPGPGSAMTFF